MLIISQINKKGETNEKSNQSIRGTRKRNK